MSNSTESTEDMIKNLFSPTPLGEESKTEELSTPVSLQAENSPVDDSGLITLPQLLNVENEDDMKEYTTKYLEKGYKGIQLLEGKYVGQVIYSPDEAEEILIHLYGKDIDKADDPAKIKETVEEILIGKVDERTAFMVREYCKMVDYNKALMEPILKMNSYFISKFEEIDPLEFMFKKKQIDILTDIQTMVTDIRDQSYNIENRLIEIRNGR